jgi:integrase
MLVVAIYVGLRPGELRALAWDRRVLQLRRSRTAPRKNGRAHEVPLLPPAIEVLGAWCEQVRAGKGVAALIDWCGLRMTAQCSRSDTMLDCRVRLSVGIKRHIRFHDLRHTCASHRCKARGRRR